MQIVKLSFDCIIDETRYLKRIKSLKKKQQDSYEALLESRKKPSLKKIRKDRIILDSYPEPCFPMIEVDPISINRSIRY